MRDLKAMTHCKNICESVCPLILTQIELLFWDDGLIHDQCVDATRTSCTLFRYNRH